VHFLAVNASLRWLFNVVGVYLVQVSLLLIVQQGLGVSSGIGPFYLLAGGLCKFYNNAGGKQPMPQCKQQANPFFK
jgi:hypothetical protein